MFVRLRSAPGIAVPLGGHAELDQRLPRWNQQSNRLPLLVVRDRDPSPSVECHADIVERLAGGPSHTPLLTVRLSRDTARRKLVERAAARSMSHAP